MRLLGRPSVAARLMPEGPQPRTRAGTTTSSGNARRWELALRYLRASLEARRPATTPYQAYSRLEIALSWLALWGGAGRMTRNRVSHPCAPCTLSAFPSSPLPAISHTTCRPTAWWHRLVSDKASPGSQMVGLEFSPSCAQSRCTSKLEHLHRATLFPDSRCVRTRGKSSRLIVDMETVILLLRRGARRAT